MRRLLKSISNGSSTSIGDVSTLEDGTSLEEVRQAYDDLHKSTHGGRDTLDTGVTHVAHRENPWQTGFKYGG